MHRGNEPPRGLSLPSRLAMLAALAVAMLFAACGDDETATPAPSPTTPATATGTGTASPTATATAADLISQFPAEAQPLLADLPQNLVELLWKVRQAGPGSMVLAGPGGEAQEGQDRAFFDNWETITGWTVDPAPGAGGGAPVDFVEKVNSGDPPWDLVEADDYAQALRWERDGLLQKFDLSLFPIDRLAPGDLYTDYGVDAYDVSTLLAWNTEVFPMDGKHPETVSDLFNTTDFPGKRCIFGYSGAGQLEIALQADGVPPEQVYDLLNTEEGLARAFAKLDTIKDDIVYTSGGAESIQFLLDGQCDLTWTYNGRVALRVKDEPDLPVAVTQKGAFLIAGPFVIPVGAEQYDAALSAAAYALQPQSQCNLMNTLGYGVVTDPTCLDDFGRAWGPNTAEATLTMSPEFYLENASKISEAWEAWKTQ